MAYFPFMIELKHQKCIIGGGGKVAARKVETMLEFGAEVTVIAPEISGEIMQMAGEHLTIKTRAISEEDIAGAAVVIMATDDEKVNSRMAAFCRAHHILVNVVDVKEECGFYFPAIIKQENVVIAVSTGGGSPLLAARIKKEIQKNLDHYYGRLADTLGKLRERVLSSVTAASGRKEAFAELMEKGLLQEGIIMPEQVEETIEKYSMADNAPKKNIIRIGTRGSALALIQTDLVIQRLRQEYPQVSFEKVILSTRGDRQINRPLLEFGGKAVFVEEFEEAIRTGAIDMAVHSAKDMPTELAEGLVIAGVLPRADVRDVLIYRKNSAFAEYAENSLSKTSAAAQDNSGYIIGTSSLRRQYQIQEIYSDIQTKPLRGNVNTRLAKLRNGDYDAIILAAAGIKRMELEKEPDLEYRYFSCQEMLPAACQAIIAVETAGNGQAQDMAAHISDSGAMLQLKAERKVLELIQAGCKEPVGVYAECDKEHMSLSLMLVKNGEIFRNTVCGSSREWEALACRAAEEKC